MNIYYETKFHNKTLLNNAYYAPSVLLIFKDS